MTEEIDTETGLSWEEAATPLGWHPQDDFNGDPETFVSAEDFVKKGRESLPILRENMRKTSAELSELRTVVQEQKEYYEQSSAAEQKRLQADYDERLAEIVANGDTAGFAKLEKPEAPEPTQPNMSPEAQRFTAENDWYGTDTAMTASANAISAELASQFPGFSIEQNLNKTMIRLKDEFPQKFTNGKSGSPVEGGRRIAQKKSGHTYDDLPQEAKDTCNRFIKQGVVKDKDAYLKNFQWERADD